MKTEDWRDRMAELQSSYYSIYIIVFNATKRALFSLTAQTPSHARVRAGMEPKLDFFFLLKV